MIRKLVLAAMIAAAPVAAFAEGKVHKLVFHVDENDPQKMNIVLNNVSNAMSTYEEMGDEVTVEIVAHGPGLNMFLVDSPVKDRISTMSLERESLEFSACGNTIKGMTKKLGKEPELLDEARVVPAGVVRIVELQEEGYSYLKP